MLARRVAGVVAVEAGGAQAQQALLVPVALGVGIGGYFSLSQEPGPLVWGGLAILVTAGLGVLSFVRPTWRPMVFLTTVVLLGAALAGLRTHLVAAPVLGWHYYGAIEGRIVDIDRSLSDAPRLTLDRVMLERISPERMPVLVRVALHGAQDFVVVEPGMRVMLTGHLSPPGGPTEPGAFEYARLAFFQQIGAVGYTRSPVLLVAPAQQDGLEQGIRRLRMSISAAVQSSLPGEGGAFAAAILTGDRSGIGRATLDSLRGSNLAHLLAISGLHMGLLTGIVFGGVRSGLALVPAVALRVPGKKIAAVIALAGAAFYLALSGGNVATQRAFVMVAVMLLAVLADRRAISLRSVAIAATIILVLRPEAVVQVGFQMSFAATVALVATFGALRDWRKGASPDQPRLPIWLSAPLGVVICSTVAGLATAPVAAAAFNRVAEYGLLANLLAVPVMGSIVMPAAVAAGVLAPFGLAQPALWLMDLGTRWILMVAEGVAGLDGAVMAVVEPPPWVLPVMMLGGLWLILWPGYLRWLGPIAIAIGTLGWQGTPRPALLVAETGTLIGVMGPEGRTLSKMTGERFAARSWLEADGDGGTVEVAFERPGLLRDGNDSRFEVAGLQGVHLTGRGAAARAEAACRDGALVILGAQADARVTERASAGQCHLVDRASLARTGALAIDVAANGTWRIKTARDRAGERPWSWR